jgi:hypothetical protein
VSPRGRVDQQIRDPLPGLREQLTSEYADVVPPDRIEQVARHALEEFESANIRDFVPVFAWRRARQHLRQAP